MGRGCWAGPLVAAAVGLSQKSMINGLNDSKLLSAKKRLALDLIIRSETDLIGVGWVWPEEINQLGLTESVRLAMQRAFDHLPKLEAEIIIDGNINYLSHLPHTTALIKADGSVLSVSAASIIAKVARDSYMAEIALKHPEYGFENHVGYGTQQHILALKQYGILPLHRIKYKPIQEIMSS